jgi:hypothetical protein
VVAVPKSTPTVSATALSNVYALLSQASRRYAGATTTCALSISTSSVPSRQV